MVEVRKLGKYRRKNLKVQRHGKGSRVEGHYRLFATTLDNKKATDKSGGLPPNTKYISTGYSRTPPKNEKTDNRGT
jgi:hypothetical protein